MKFISFTEVSIPQQILKNCKILSRYKNFSTDGIFSKKCSLYFEKTLNVPKALMTKSCTSALEMCAILLNIKEGDEIIFPSYAYVSTINAFVLRGAKPIFVDIDANNLNIDVMQLEKKINKKTKAIVIINYAGGYCEIFKIIKLKKKYNIFILKLLYNINLLWKIKKPLL